MNTKHGRSDGDTASTVLPLGVFGCIASQPEFELLRSELEDLVEQAPSGAERSEIVSYLRGGAIVFALMESTHDVLRNAFQVPGGSAVLTDGVYYWRRDAADYAQHHGVGLPAAFIEHGRRERWVPPRLSSETVLRTDRHLLKHGRRVHRTD